MWSVGKLDEEYIDKMEDVLKTYEKPLSDDEPVICVDEKPVVLHEDTRPPIPMQPGQVARRDYEYKRCGTANVFCGIEPKAGVHFTKVTPTRSSPEFADFLLSIAGHYPAAHTIHLVMDNLSTHTRKALVERFGEEDGGWLWERFTVHSPQAWKLAPPGRDPHPLQSIPQRRLKAWCSRSGSATANRCAGARARSPTLKEQD